MLKKISVYFLLIVPVVSFAHSPFSGDARWFQASRCVMGHRRFHFVPTALIKKAISATQLLRDRGSWAYWDKRSNTVWYCLLPGKAARLSQFLSGLDHPLSQVKVAVRIVSVDQSWLNAMGVKWGHTQVTAGSDHGVVALNWLTGPIGAHLWAEIEAKQSKNIAELVASPILVTNNNETASIESGDKIPYQEHSDEGYSSTSFKKATLRLAITPTILPDKKLDLKINLDYGKVSTLSVAGMPAIRAQHLQTNIVVGVGELAVLGGIIESRTEHLQVGVPLLSRLPLLGRIFRYHKRVKTKKQLLIFILPTVVHVSDN